MLPQMGVPGNRGAGETDVGVRMMEKVSVTMIGTDFSTKGGVAAVVNAYREAGLFQRWPISYIASHCDGSKIRKLAAFGGALVRFYVRLCRGEGGIVHVHSASNASFWRKCVFLFGAFLARRPVVFHLHGGGFPEFFFKLDPLRKAIVRSVLARTSRVIALSEGWRDTVRQISPEARVLVIPNPVQTWDDKSEGAEVGGALRITFLGRVVREKGVYDLLTAFKGIAEEFPSAELVIGGEGEIDQLSAAARELGIASRLRCLGWVHAREKRALLSRSVTLVLPSYVEGLPMVLLEAMAAGLPVIATKVGAIPEVVRSGEDGILVEPGDIAGMVKALRGILGDVRLREHLGKNAQRLVRERFSAKQVIAQIEAVYLDLSRASA